MTELIDKEFSPVLHMVLERGPSGLENLRRGTHAITAPEVIDHCKVLLSEARKCCDKLAANKRRLEEQEKRLVAELAEQRSMILGEMEREVNEARSRLKAMKEKKELEQQQQQQQQLLSSNNNNGDQSREASPSSSSSPSETAAFLSRNQKSPAANLLATLNKKDDNSAPPGDVDYWRAQAQDLSLVVEGRRETLKSVQARIRSISHLNEHQERARGIIGLLRQAESNERQKAAEYLRKAHQIKDQSGMNNNNNNSKDSSSSSSASDASAIAMLTEAETNGLESILNTLEPRVEVAKEALRGAASRVEKLQSRLQGIENRRKQLASVGHTLPQILKYVGDVKTETQNALSKVDPPNLAIVNILKKQHGEALVRLNKNADSLLTLKLEVADLETQLREARVNAIRSMHGTATGTAERLAQLRALRAAEVVQNQIQGIEKECENLRTSIYSSPTTTNITSTSSSGNTNNNANNARLRANSLGGYPVK